MCGWVLQHGARPRAFNGPIVSLRIVSAAAAPCRISEDMQPRAQLQRAGALRRPVQRHLVYVRGGEVGEAGGGGGGGALAGNPPRSCNQGSPRSQAHTHRLHEGRAYLRRAATGRQERGEKEGEAPDGSFMDAVCVLQFIYTPNLHCRGNKKKPRNVAVHSGICISNTG